MASPSMARVIKVDKQGRAVIPQDLRVGLTTTPGEVIAEQTPDGLLLRSTGGESGAVVVGDDGLPVLLGAAPVRNDEVLAAIDAERRSR